MDNTLNDDLARMTLQERRLQFKHFDKALAWELGTRFKTLCEQRGLAVTIEVRLCKETVFLYAMPGTQPENADWARRKRNVVEIKGRSSYCVGLMQARDGETLEALMGLSTADYASHGGSFPLIVQGMGMVGVVTVSGLPQREDHELVVEVLAGMCGVELAEIAFGG